MKKRIKYQLLIEDATSLRETAAEFAEGRMSFQEYRKFLYGYPGPYKAEGKKLLIDGAKRARTRLRNWFSRNYGKDYLDFCKCCE